MAVEREARIDAITEHAPGVRSLVLRLPPGQGLRFRPGQFLSCLLPVGSERLIRPYSIASDPEHGEALELLFNRVPDGPGTTYLFDLRPGDVLRFTGPWGTFCLDRAPDAETVFVAEQTAIAPIRPMIRRAARTARHPLHLLYGTTLPLWRDELTTLPGVEATTVAPDALEATVQRRWIDADAVRSRHFFICGIGGLVVRLRDRLRAAGYERRAVQYERW